MTVEVLYKTCPVCQTGSVTAQSSKKFSCAPCGLVVADATSLYFRNRGKYRVQQLGGEKVSIAKQGLRKAVASKDELKVALGNVYPDPKLAQFAAGELAELRPVPTVLAQIILEQLREECFIQIRNIKLGHGPVLSGPSSYLPRTAIDPTTLTWQKEGNFFATSKHLVLPSNQFTFIRLGRKISTIQAYTNGFAVQVKGNEYGTYFVGAHAHEAALVATYVLGKLPALRPSA